MGRTARLGWLPGVTLAAMLGPVLMGLAGTVAPAFGILPGAGIFEPGLAAFDRLVAWHGLGDAIRLSLTTGVLATAISLAVVMLITAGWHGTRAFRALERLLSPLLSVPHAAAAFGFAFLIAPSGWIARALSPWATGWAQPPDVLLVQDPWGLSLTAGLIAKEVPFLLLMTLAALSQADAARSLSVARALGYGRMAGWIRVVFPRVYAQIRLPVFVVLAYSMSVVDVAMILGPNTPSTLSVQILRWMNDPDLAQRLVAAAGAVAQLALVAGALIGWRGAEVLAARWGRQVIFRGTRHGSDRGLRLLALLAGLGSAAAVVAGLVGLVVWSVAGFWAWPDAWPAQLTTASWARHGAGALGAAGDTMLIAGAATLAALVLTIGCLEAEHRYRLPLTRRALVILYVPLIVPQIAFLPGVQTLFLGTGAGQGLGPVILVHLVFVLPYVFLSLGDPWRAWDARYATIGTALGAGADRVLWRIRLPMLLSPVLTAAAVGFAVSVGQYLPTLLIGGGRVTTLTTEAVALASGGDRRAIGVYALAQTAAALIPFALALSLPRLVWRNRRGVSHG